MLLRQLYLAYFETRRFERAAEVAEQVLALGVLSDVAHQDAARAKQALGDIEGAVGHLRWRRARGRRAGGRSTGGRWAACITWRAGTTRRSARLARAARWGTRDKPLYQGHLAVVQCESGKAVERARRADRSARRCRQARGTAGSCSGRWPTSTIAGTRPRNTWKPSSSGAPRGGPRSRSRSARRSRRRADARASLAER